MRNQKLYESVRKYIDKYYIDRHEEDAVESYAVESIQKTKATDTISLTLPVNRNIESLMGQMDETIVNALVQPVETILCHHCHIKFQCIKHQICGLFM